MLSSRAMALPTDGDLDGSSFNNMDVRTPAKAALRTPGRTLHKSRIALQENAGYDGNGGTLKKKGKAGGSHTPFHPAIQARKDLLQSARKHVVVASRPLGDKTPAPNRHQTYQPMQTPAPHTIKMTKLSIVEAAEENFIMPTPGAYLRPSSARRNSRAPRASGNDPKMLFKTPATNGRHWEVSGADIEVNIDEADTEGADVEVVDHDEIEYMPPKMPEQSYEPPFDMPDYKVMGRTLMSLGWMDPVDESLDVKYAEPIEQDINVDDLLVSSYSEVWEKPALPELSDEADPFEQFVVILPITSADSGKQRLPGSRSTRPVPSRPATIPTARPLTRVATVSTSRVAARIPSTVKPGPAPRTTSNTPAPGSTSTTSRNAATIKRPMTSMGTRAPAPKSSESKGAIPVKESSIKASSANALKRATVGPVSSVVRPRSVIGRLSSMTSRPATSAVTAKPAVALTAPMARTRSATIASSSRTTFTGPQSKAAPTVAKTNALFNVDPDEPEDFVFEV